MKYLELAILLVKRNVRQTLSKQLPEHLMVFYAEKAYEDKLCFKHIFSRTQYIQ